ncbi:hypothetical protein HDU81_007003 [Chytriomyces hyalinus]|nr:hypothetical protein HDU81_007003 [Chytriomyces hyalinus]
MRQQQPDNLSDGSPQLHPASILEFRKSVDNEGSSIIDVLVNAPATMKAALDRLKDANQEVDAVSQGTRSRKGSDASETASRFVEERKGPLDREVTFGSLPHRSVATLPKADGSSKLEEGAKHCGEHRFTMACCETAKWKREEIPDHKFDYIDVDDFIDDNWVRKLQYSFIFFLTVKSVLVYTADLTILALMIDSGVFTNSIDCGASSGTGEASSTTDLTKGFGAIFCTNGTSITSQLAPKTARPWIMLASVIMSLVLLLLDWRKGRIVIKSRDISYSLTNHVAYRYYVLKSYPHYCFFSEILNSRKSVDVLAFFVFFAFKSWKRLFLAEFPRVYINVLNMYDVLKGLIPPDLKYENPIIQYANAIAILFASRAKNGAALATLILSTFTITMWFFSFCVIVAAFFMYFPLLYIVRGNLKEYVCHKIDKRISEILKKKSRKRTEEARKAELAELERLQQLKARAKNGDPAAGGHDPDALAFKAAAPLGLTQRPTLPDIDVDLDAPDFDVMSNYGSNYSNSEYGTYQTRGFNQPPPPPSQFGGPNMYMGGPPGSQQPIMPPVGMMQPPFSPNGNPLPPGAYMPGPPPLQTNLGYMNGRPFQQASLARSNNSSESPSGDSGSFKGYNTSSQPLLHSNSPVPNMGSSEGIPLKSLGGGAGGYAPYHPAPPPQQQQHYGDDQSIRSGPYMQQIPAQQLRQPAYQQAQNNGSIRSGASGNTAQYRGAPPPQQNGERRGSDRGDGGYRSR